MAAPSLPPAPAGLLLAAALLASAPATSAPAPAPDPPLQASQYAHASWTARDGALLGLVFAMAQTPDGYLWVGGSFGLFRFDGLRFMPWRPPQGQSLPGNPYALLVSRDGTLWIGTFNGLASWDGKALRRYAPTDGGLVTSLLEDRDGTVWAGMLANPGQLCAVRDGAARCSEEGGRFGSFVWSLAEDGDGALWLGADSGLWRWRPGAPERFVMPGMRVGDLSTTADGQLLVGVRGAGLMRFERGRLVPYPVPRPTRPDDSVPDRELRSNKLLKSRDGGLWIGTEGHGILHLQDGQADTFTRADGLSGNIACSLFEDREGNLWYGSEKGVDRFHKLPVTTISVQQGLPNEGTKAVLATPDGSVWIATDEGLARTENGRFSVYRQRDGLPDARVQSLYQDAGGRLWVSTAGGLAYLAGERFVAVAGVPGKEVYSITGDDAGNLWLSGNEGLVRLRDGRFAGITPWQAFGRRQQAKVILADRGGVWLSFWQDGGVMYVKDGKVQATYSAERDGLGAGHVAGLRLDAEGAVWAATENGGLSRIKDGRVATLDTGSGLPCDTVHWSMLDEHGALWMHAACGLLRIAPDDLAAWIADPGHRVEPRQWGAAEGVPLLAFTPAYFNPPVARARDGRLWFVSGADVQVVDPDYLPVNPLPPPVHIEALSADHDPYPVEDGVRLPPLVRDLTIEFAALSLVDPKNTRFRYRLEGHDDDWQEVIDRRQASYTNLPPGRYRFQVKAANNSGLWNEDGARLEFSILPAFHQTTWFRASCAVLVAGLAWCGFQLWLRMRIRRLRREFETTLDVRVGERTRIARDLHDTLLQRFHGLLLQFQAAFNLLPDRPDDSKKVLASAIDQVAQAITDGRDAVQGLRASTQESNNLAGALRSLAEDLANDSGQAATARVDVIGSPRALHPLVRDEAFRVAGEALRNAFHHADAKRIDVEIRYDGKELSVRVRDDGKGIDAEVLRAGEKQGHFGLSGMRERAKLVGGELSVRSELGAGSEVVFRVPGTRAYSRSASARSWFLHKKFSPSEISE
ncbi:sensor histidine kinase [Mitsuaria sp. GD03876]|uniref:sensor histidine kinase n=1 Tax=Mitsuaria sp. GD03876 TaxID=2975399 RepID=UPI002447948C|nr:sensor histidine kinase [Mitsuaria sp. GD03876]MDH0865930.1 histidine kinase [Mitsuaria sp. GD03876]